jgi:hypothetical protein
VSRPYEKIYCAGDIENRIKECQLDLFADRTSSATMRAYQVRLWFASFAYVPPLRPAPHRPQGHAVPQGQLHSHPPLAAQNRRPRADLGPPHQARYVLVVFRSTRLQDSPLRGSPPRRADEPETV